MANLQSNDQPWADEIVAEVRAAREQLFAACGHDLKELAKRMRAEQEAGGRPAVAFPKRNPQRPIPA